MSTHITSDIQIKDGQSLYTINVSTDNIDSFKVIQEVAHRVAQDKNTKTDSEDKNITFPYVDIEHELSRGKRIIYRCCHCDCNLTDRDDVFYVHCPRCGYKIDYSHHDELRRNKNVIQ